MRGLDFLGGVRPSPWAKYAAVWALVAWAFAAVFLWTVWEMRMHAVREAQTLADALSAKRQALETELQSAQTDLARAADRSRAVEAIRSSRTSVVQLFDDIRARMVQESGIDRLQYATADGLIITLEVRDLLTAAEAIDRLRDLPPYAAEPAFHLISRQVDGMYRFELQWAAGMEDAKAQEAGDGNREESQMMNETGGAP
ncbi:MAG: hypothetical protein IMW86_08100 [Hydrogenibacillus sp.]|nr:hypothetical protein [Hydrogenibacillus sp.]